MSIKTARAEGVAEVLIDYEACIACGLCARVCKGAPLYMENGKVQIDQSCYFGCIACGQCVAVCPQHCITVTGRDFTLDDVLQMPTREERATYAQLQSLMLGRRSVRDFKDKPVVREYIDQIVSAAATAPMGLPPSDVQILIFDGKDKVAALSNDLLDWMQSIQWIVSPVMRAIMRPFVGKETGEVFDTFLAPALDAFLKKRAENIDWLTYSAPLAMYFYTSAYADPVDPLIVATYAMLAAESLGLGSCMLGTPAYCFKYSKKLRRKYGMPNVSQQGILVIFGHPAVTYRRALRRRLGGVQFY
ncbi:MAG: nitroreductase family protein [Anaerolineae bacterium]|nr:nitroreductase family protein [Anaerolineae bacterium]